MKSLFSFVSVASACLFCLPAETCGAAPNLPQNGTVAEQSRFANPHLSLSDAALGDFDSTFSELAKQAKVTFVFEGQPLHTRLSEKKTQELKSKMGASGLPLEELATELAVGYDYAVTRPKESLFVFTKKYSDENDLPELSFAEVVRALRGIRETLRNYLPTTNRFNSLKDVYSSLSADQKRVAAQGLTISTVSNEQRQMMRQFAGGIQFRGADNVGTVLFRLDACRRENAHFAKKIIYGVEVPVYEGTFALYNFTDNVALSTWVYTQSGGATIYEVPPGAEFKDNKLIFNKPDMIDPTDPRSGPRFNPPPPSRFRVSLRTLTQQLKSRTTPDGKTAPFSASVDDALASKTVCVVGSEFASPETLLKAASDVYGLSLKVGNNAAHITSTPIRRLEDISQAPDEVKRLVPAPFTRAVQGMSGRQLYITTVRRLRERIEPEMAKRPNRVLPLSEAGAEAYDLIALSSLATLEQELDGLTETVPAFVTNFDGGTIALSSRVDEEGRTIISYGFATPSKDGKTRSRINGQMTYPRTNP